MKDLTMIIAHPDDEVIFGSVVLKEAKRIVCIASDENNPNRQWCKDRKKALYEIGELVGAEVICFNYNSEFYRINARLKELIILEEKIKPYLTGTIFTHNAWGEYGHLDHILINQIVRANYDRIWVTDICLFGDWFTVKRFNQGKRVFNAEIGTGFYEKCKAIYDKYGCWTWDETKITEVGVYEITDSDI